MKNENKLKKEHNLTKHICEEHNNDDCEKIIQNNILNEDIINKSSNKENLDIFKIFDDKKNDYYDKNLKNELMKKENLNEVIKVKKIKKENNDLENNLKLYKKIKRAIIEICSKIESNLNYIYNETNETNEKSTNMKNSNIFNTVEKNNYVELIKEYKAKINSSQEEINIVMRLNNIDLLDNEINTKEKISQNLKFENSFLNKVNRKQIKNIYVLDSKKKNREDIKQMNNKIINLKEEIKLKKEYLKLNSIKISNQNSIIKKLEKKCLIIKENIEYQKNKKINELKNKNIKNSNSNNLDILNLQFSTKNDLFHSNEKKYINLIEQQKLMITQIKTDIDSLNYQIKEIDKQILKNKLKHKSIKKISPIKKSTTCQNIYQHNINMTKRNILKPIQPRNNSVIFNNKWINIKERNKSVDNIFLKPLKNTTKKIKVKIIKNNTFNEIEQLKLDIQQFLKKETLFDKYNHNCFNHKTTNSRNIHLKKIKIPNKDIDEILISNN